MLILANLSLLPLTATFLRFGKGTPRCSLAEINSEISSGKYSHPFSIYLGVSYLLFNFEIVLKLRIDFFSDAIKSSL